MLATVAWHRDRAAPGYVEIEYDPKAWNEHAARYATANKLLLSPLLPLIAFRLVEIARATPRINATIVGEQRFQYHAMNLGFTVQAGATLYLAVVRNAHEMNAARFIDALGEVQRHAVAHKLGPSESSGATLSFSSMARWEVARHIPILPPYTALIVAHAAQRAAGHAVLGASYDHRLLTGFDVVNVLRALAQPPA
jgi:pyruvate/2-oxoglutarate dehydrogenase complex dihydrolipoamide acyltransferase (E2) component